MHPTHIPPDGAHDAPAPGRARELLRGIADDVKILARDELARAQMELRSSMKVAAGDAAAVVLSGIVALIGLAMLCVSAVTALAPTIPSLTVRLLIMAAAYLLVGGIVAVIFVRRLRRDVVPDLSRTKQEASRTAAVLRQELGHA
jgi:hypothetical protein